LTPILFSVPKYTLITQKKGFEKLWFRKKLKGREVYTKTLNKK